MNLQSKYIQDGSGTKYAPITTPNAVRWPDGTNLEDQISFLGYIPLEAPVNSTNSANPIDTLNCEFGKYYRIDVPIGTLALNLPEITNNEFVQSIIVNLTIGSNFAITITSDNGEDIYYQEGLETIIANVISGETLELNFLWNGLYWTIAGIKIFESV